MTLSIAKWKLDDYHRIVEMGLLDECPVELLYGEIVEMSPEGEPLIYRDPRDGEYGSKMTLTAGEVTPLAFAEIKIPVEALISAD